MKTNSSAPVIPLKELVPESLYTAPETAIRELLILLDKAIVSLQRSLDWNCQASSTIHSSLIPGGVVLITDDGRGIGRAVAADLRALGHPVLRVQHGVGSVGIQGVNLSSAASVAALVERTRQLGPLAAIVHLAPLGGASLEDPSTHSSDYDESRKLNMLLWASAKDLARSAASGGACFIVAGSTSQWIDPLSTALQQVRFRDLKLDTGTDIEVTAAIVVKEVLDSRSQAVTHAEIQLCEARIGHARKPTPCEAILIGAPNRVRWLELAEALETFLRRTPEVRLMDLAETLHSGQPTYPFRVGLVAYSVADLGQKIDLAIDSIQDPECHTLHNREGIYWTESGVENESINSLGSITTREATYFQSRRSPSTSKRKNEPGAVSIPFPSAQEWLHHETASRFGRGEPVNIDMLSMGRRAKKFDLRTLCVEPTTAVVGPNPEMERVALLHEVIRLMDGVLEHEKRLALELLRA